MKMFVAGEWTGSPEESVITSPYSGEVVDAVPVATTAPTSRARSWRRSKAHGRWRR